MTIEQAEETLRAIIPYRYNVPPDKIREAEKTILDAIKGGAHIANFYGMTVDAERRVMKNALRLIRIIVDDYVFGCDGGSEDWRDYFKGYYSDGLESTDEMIDNANYPSDFCYHLPSDEWLFKELISWGTTRGGMGSACEECRKIGKVLKGDDES